jgi:acetylornithine deacetylase/succinyl-diaminopimelate desuccinylase-like protein
MALDSEAAKKVLAHIDRNELARLGCDLTSIPSPTGQEKAIAEFILAWFEGNGLKAARQKVEINRPNAVGILKGDGTGYSLSFNGHTDTSFTGTREDLRIVVNIEPDDELRGRIVGDKVQGLGISNMKGGLASFVMAGKALKKSGIKLKGDVILAAVVGEISRTPIGPWQSQEYRGEGVGTRHLLPGVCSIYVDVRMPPQVRPVAIQRGLEQALNATGADFEMDTYKSLLGHQGKNVEPLVKCAEEVHRHLFGENIKPESPDRASIWTDTNIYNELGTPAIKIGPRGWRISARNEEIDIDVMVKAAQIYALMALDICGRTRRPEP